MEKAIWAVKRNIWYEVNIWSTTQWGRKDSYLYMNLKLEQYGMNRFWLVGELCFNAEQME
jgi:hypothetical protein